MRVTSGGGIRVRRPGAGGSLSLDVAGEPDLELLGAFLSSDRAPPGCLGLSGLDGLLTGVLAGPETIMPSEWMPAVWGGEGPIFDDAEEAQAVTGAMLQRYSAILRGLGAKPPRVEPIMAWSGEKDPGADWCNGFRRAIVMRPDGWRLLLADKTTRSGILPIFVLSMPPEQARAELGLGPDDLEELRSTPQLIPACVIAIDRFFKAVRRKGLLGRAAPASVRKVGRNAPCPCGSGRKHKQCCGAA